MSDDARARRQHHLGLILAAVITPLAAICTALAAAIGALLLDDARKRLHRTETQRKAAEAAPARLAAPRPAGRTDHRRPRRGPSSRHSGRILH